MLSSTSHLSTSLSPVTLGEGRVSPSITAFTTNNIHSAFYQSYVNPLTVQYTHAHLEEFLKDDLYIIPDYNLTLADIENDRQTLPVVGLNPSLATGHNHSTKQVGTKEPTISQNFSLSNENASSQFDSSNLIYPNAPPNPRGLTNNNGRVNSVPSMSNSGYANQTTVTAGTSHISIQNPPTSHMALTPQLISPTIFGKMDPVSTHSSSNIPAYYPRQLSWQPVMHHNVIPSIPVRSSSLPVIFQEPLHFQYLQPISLPVQSGPLSSLKAYPFSPNFDLTDGDKTNKRFTRSQIQLLKTSYKNQLYPSDDEKVRLSDATGLSVKQVNNWFTNKRNRSKASPHANFHKTIIS